MNSRFYRIDHRVSSKDCLSLTVHRMMKVGGKIRWQSACKEHGLIEATLVQLPTFATGMFRVHNMDDGSTSELYIEQIKEIRLTDEERQEWVKIANELIANPRFSC